MRNGQSNEPLVGVSIRTLALSPMFSGHWDMYNRFLWHRVPDIAGVGLTTSDGRTQHGLLGQGFEVQATAELGQGFRR
jgi:hypothetical protein